MLVTEVTAEQLQSLVLMIVLASVLFGFVGALLYLLLMDFAREHLVRAKPAKKAEPEAS
jgi:hypothetical protein